MTELGAFPLKAAKVSPPSEVSYRKTKQKKVGEVSAEKVATVLSIDKDELHPEATNVWIKPSNHEDLNKFSLNKKVKASLRLEKVQLLILARRAGPSIEQPQNLEQTITWPSKPENCKRNPV